MTRDAREIEREGMLSDMETLRAEKRELHAEIERLKAAYESRGGEMDSMREVLAATQKWNEDRVAEVERLRRLVDEREADLGRMHGETSAEIERLTDAIQRIDGINDNPADYNPAINAVCDAILRAPKP